MPAPTTLEQRARDVVERLRKRSHHYLNALEGEADGDLMRKAYCLIEDLLEERSAYVDIERIELRNALSGRE